MSLSFKREREIYSKYVPNSSSLYNSNREYLIKRKIRFVLNHLFHLIVSYNISMKKE